MALEQKYPNELYMRYFQTHLHEIIPRLCLFLNPFLNILNLIFSFILAIFLHILKPSESEVLLSTLILATTYSKLLITISNNNYL